MMAGHWPVTFSCLDSNAHVVLFGWERAGCKSGEGAGRVVRFVEIYDDSVIFWIFGHQETSRRVAAVVTAQVLE